MKKREAYIEGKTPTGVPYVGQPRDRVGQPRDRFRYVGFDCGCATAWDKTPIQEKAESWYFAHVCAKSIVPTERIEE